MTKKIIALILFVAVLFPATAQKLGVIGGYQLTNDIVMESSREVNFNSRPGSGFNVGAFFEWDITNRWGLDASAQYTLRNYRFNMHYLSDTTTRFNRSLFYLDVPVHGYVNFFAGKTVISIFAGPVLGIGLHGKDIGWQDTPDKRPVFLKENDLFGKDNRLVYFEIAADLGVAVKYENYQVRASYQIGLNNTTKQDYDWSLNLNSNIKKIQHQGVFKLSFAYVWDLRK